MMSKERLPDLIKDGKFYFSATNTGECEHNNGWYVTVRFWIFKKRIFVCSDCGESIDVWFA